MAGTEPYLFAGGGRCLAVERLRLLPQPCLETLPTPCPKRLAKTAKKNAPEGAEMSRFCFCWLRWSCFGSSSSSAKVHCGNCREWSGRRKSGILEIKKGKKLCCSANPLGNSQFSVITVQLSVNVVRTLYQIFACQMSRTGEF